MRDEMSGGKLPEEDLDLDPARIYKDSTARDVLGKVIDDLNVQPIVISVLRLYFGIDTREASSVDRITARLRISPVACDNYLEEGLQALQNPRLRKDIAWLFE